MRSAALSLLVFTFPLAAMAQDNADGAGVIQPSPPAVLATAPAPVEAPAVPAAPPFERDCWNVVQPAQGTVAFVPAGESEASVVQAGFGALTRRAVYNAEGMETRLGDTGARQEDLLMDLRVKKVAVPLAVGVAGVVTGVSLVLVGGVSAVLWLVSGQANLPLINNDTRGGTFALYGLFVLAVAGIPLGILALGGGVIPLVLGGLRAMSLGEVPESPLLDQTGFSANEAHEVAATHNQRLAKRLGTQGTPACTAR